MNAFSREPEFLTRVHNTRILVIGDLMLDHYIFGKVSRLSPEAPIPVLEVREETWNPGGAANVVMNVHAFGAMAFTAGILGDDDSGKKLREIFKEAGILDKFLFTAEKRPTTVKSRVIGNGHHITRLDREVTHSIDKQLEDKIIYEVTELVNHFHAIIFQDYDKGLITPRLIEAVMKASAEYEVPVIVDPKFRNFFSYAGCTVFKPNLKELGEALGRKLDNTDIEGITEAVAALRERMPHHNTLVTLSENGMLLVDERLEATHIPAVEREVRDVSGAGDSVVSLFALSLAAGYDMVTSARIANIAGGLSCEKIGAQPVEPAKLVDELVKAGLEPA